MRRARPAWSAWLAGAGRRRARGGRHARARPAAARRAARCAARSARRRPRSCTRGRSAEPHLDWERALAEPALASAPPALDACTHEPYSLGAGPRVVVLDLGCKRSIVRRLAETGVEADVVPGTWDADAVLELDPAAVLVGNGPGDPAQLVEQVETVRALLGRVPVFGICLGHQLVALALGLRTFKLPVRPPRRQPPGAACARRAACS